MARELEWVQMGAKARQAKGKARLSAYERLLAEANEARDQTRELEIAIPPNPRLGDAVIEVKDLRKGYGDRLLIIASATRSSRADEHRGLSCPVS